MNFNSLVLKVASRCNLNCSYCFMYNLGDTTYKKQPKFMSSQIVDAILEKTKRYVQRYKKKEFSFTFHGGEPLLASKEFYRTFMYKFKKLQEELKEVSFLFYIQTNGVLIDEEWIDLFKEFNISPGISVDGTSKAHDMFRVDHKGKGSYTEVFKAASLLKKEMNYTDIACVININEKPREIYDSFKNMNVDHVNFLIPDYTHDNFPFDDTKTEMADWLVQLFDIWVNDIEKFNIPMFIGLMNSFLRIGRDSLNEATVLVIETNGEIEAVDSLKTCGHGFTKTRLNITNNELDEIENTSLGKLYFNDFNRKLCRQCEKCPIKEVCRGGRLVHRYSKEKGFNNPSVYCKDLVTLIAHIQNYFITFFPELHEKENIEAIDANEVIQYLTTINKGLVTAKEKELESFSVENRELEKI